MRFIPQHKYWGFLAWIHVKKRIVGEEKILQKKMEDISKKFYEQYNDLIHGVKRISREDCLVKSILHVDSEEDREEIAQVVIDRLIFIKFLEAKGIIKEHVLDFLYSLEEHDLNLKLNQLFFEVMSTKKKERGSVDPHFVHIPYLNGSLFEKFGVEKRNPSYKIRARILHKVIEFLNKFKFVHHESLGGNGDFIDPEILGYIFERAMTATDRKGTGAYYTPKEITRYIAENTIYPNIIDKVNEFLIKKKGYKKSETIKKIDELFILRETTLNEVWNKIILNLSVCDNACGSGAFLLATANILLDLNKKINNKLGLSNTDVALKKLILKSLYGVDINPRGIEIAMLRLWLWLVESYKPEHIEPLPNIEYNLRVGNSLIGYVDIEQFETTKLTLFDYDESNETIKLLLTRFRKLKSQYRKEIGENARRLKKEIEEIRKRIKKKLDIELYRDIKVNKIEIDGEEYIKLKPFHWGFEFYEIYDLDQKKEERGFDIIVGNPPYIKLHNIDKKALKYYFKNFDTAEKKCDIYAFFTERVLKDLLKQNGYLGYIISDTWLNLDSFTNMRRIVTKNNKLVSIVTLENPFYKVSVSPIIFFVEKDKIREYIFSTSHFNYKQDMIINERQISSKHIISPGFIIDLTITKESLLLVNKIIQQSISLNQIANLQYGIMTADNKRFILTEKTCESHKPLLAGEDIQRYKINWDGQRYVDYRPNEMKKKKTARPGEPERFEQDEKIVFQRYSSTRLIAALDTSKFYTLGTTIIARSTSEYSNRYILGLVNSKLLSWWYGRTFTSPTNYIREFESIPIRKIDFDNKNDKISYNKITKSVDEKLVQKEQTITKKINKIDESIDRLVYDLYGLNKKEIEIIEESL